MSDSNAKGDRRERELVTRLDEAGFAVMRAPASGSATSRSLPDVLAGNGDDFYAVEAKSSAGDPIYLSNEEVEALTYFARNFGAKPRVGVRFDRADWAFFHPGDLHVTDGHNRRVKRAEAVELRVTNGDEVVEGEGVEDLAAGSGSRTRTDVEAVLRAFDRGVLSLEEAAAMLG